MVTMQRTRTSLLMEQVWLLPTFQSQFLYLSATIWSIIAPSLGRLDYIDCGLPHILDA